MLFSYSLISLLCIFTFQSLSATSTQTSAAQAQRLESELFSLIEKKALSKEDKRVLVSALNQPELSDETLSNLFCTSRLKESPVTQYMVRECGKRLPQDQLDLALIESLKGKDDRFSELVGDLLECTNANPHRFQGQILSAYKEAGNEYLLPALMKCPRFDPTVDGNSWIIDRVQHGTVQEMILLLSDARVASSCDFQELMTLARQSCRNSIIQFLAAHPAMKVDGSTDPTYLSPVIEHLLVAKNPNGVFSDRQKASLRTQTLIKPVVLYAALCSGNLEMIQWLKNEGFGGKFKGANLNTLFYGRPALQMASTAACHGHLHIVKYLLADKELEEDDCNRILDVAQKAGQQEIMAWIMEQFREVDERAPLIYKGFEKIIGNFHGVTSQMINDWVNGIQCFSDTDFLCPALTRQVMRDFEYSLAVSGLIANGLPIDVALIIGQEFLKHPFSFGERLL